MPDGCPLMGPDYFHSPFWLYSVHLRSRLIPFDEIERGGIYGNPEPRSSSSDEVSTAKRSFLGVDGTPGRFPREGNVCIPPTSLVVDSSESTVGCRGRSSPLPTLLPTPTGHMCGREADTHTHLPVGSGEYGETNPRSSR